MLTPINLLPWQNAQHLAQHRHYQRWALIGLLLMTVISIAISSFWVYQNQRLQANLKITRRNLQQWQPLLQESQQAQQRKLRLIEIQRWQQQWNCRWQKLLLTLPAEVSWQQAIVSIDHCHLQGHITDPAALSQWAQHVACQIHQLNVHRQADSRSFDFDVELQWP